MKKKFNSVIICGIIAMLLVICVILFSYHEMFAFAIFAACFAGMAIMLTIVKVGEYFIDSVEDQARNYYLGEK